MPKFYSKWNTVIECPFRPTVLRRSTISCWNAGIKIRWNGQRSRRCSGNLRIFTLWKDLTTRKHPLTEITPASQGAFTANAYPKVPFICVESKWKRENRNIDTLRHIIFHTPSSFLTDFLFFFGFISLFCVFFIFRSCIVLRFIFPVNFLSRMNFFAPNLAVKELIIFW